MKKKFFFGLLVLSAVIANIAGIYKENFWLAECGEFFFILPLIAFNFRELPKQNYNFLGFLLFILVADALDLFDNFWLLEYISIGLWMGCYVLLIREAIKHTEYEKGSRFTSLYFLVVVVIYAYLLALHVMELERSLTDGFLFSYYIIYYLNLLTLAVTALVYYLNSFSRKSVFFMCLTMGFIFADVFRDMEVFYFPDLSVEIMGSLIRFAGIQLAFLFFSTPEKKLRLLHLV